MNYVIYNMSCWLASLKTLKVMSKIIITILLSQKIFIFLKQFRWKLILWKWLKLCTTDNHWLLGRISMKHNLANFTLSTGTPTQNGLSPTHSHDPDYTILKDIFRHTGEHKSFLSPPNMAFHVLNAYEEDNTVGKFL